MSNKENTVKIGRDAVGNTIVQGENNSVSSKIQIDLKDPNSVDIKTEIEKLNKLLSTLEFEDKNKMLRALEDASDELEKTEVSKDEVGKSVERALNYAAKAEKFTDSIEKMQDNMTSIVSWLGESWRHMIGLIN